MLQKEYITKLIAHIRTNYKEQARINDWYPSPLEIVLSITTKKETKTITIELTETNTADENKEVDAIATIKENDTEIDLTRFNNVLIKIPRIE